MTSIADGSVIIQTSPESVPSTPSLYVKILIGPRLREDRAGLSLLKSPAGERLPPSHGSTDRTRSTFPWQRSWANR